MTSRLDHSTSPDRDGAATQIRESDKRSRILDAALELFVERGFHGTAVPLVAQRAGVAAGTIYRYFSSKEALVNTLYSEWKTRLGASVVPALGVDGSPRQVFAQVWARLCGFVAAHPRAYEFLELNHHAAYLDDESRAIEAELVEQSLSFILRAQADGALRRGPPEVLLALFHGAFVGLVRFRREGRIDWDGATLQLAEEACWGLLTAG